MGIAVSIPRPQHGTSGIAGGARALQVNVREREAVGRSGRPPFPVRPGETPSRPSKQQVAYTLNFRSSWAIMAPRFRSWGVRVPPSPVAREPYDYGWLPFRTRKPFYRTPPRERTQQLLDELTPGYDSYSDPYNPQVPN